MARPRPPASRRTSSTPRPDRSCLITEYLEGRLWTPHYFTRMRDLRSLGQRLQVLHALTPPPLARFDPLAAARRYADTICASDPQRGRRASTSLLAQWRRGARRARGSARRAATIVHSDLHHGNVLTADRVYFIDWEYAQVGDPLLDLACVMAYYPRAAAARRVCCSRPRASTSSGATAAMLAELTQRVHSADLSLVSRPPRGAHRAGHRPAARIRRAAPAAARWRPAPNLGTLAPRIGANLQVRSRRNGDVASD